MINHHSALVYTMVLASAADREMTDSELLRIGQIVTGLPVFADYDPDTLTVTTAECAALLDGDDGLDTVLRIIHEALPEKLRETAYAIACDVVAADLSASQEELRLLAMLRHRLAVDRLAAAAIERGTRARHLTL